MFTTSKNIYQILKINFKSLKNNISKIRIKLGHLLLIFKEFFKLFNVTDN